MSSNANTNPTVENPTLWVLQSLDGQTLRIPDLWPLFGSWPRGRNGKYDDLKKQLDAFLLGYIVESQALNGLLTLRPGR